MYNKSLSFQNTSQDTHDDTYVNMHLNTTYLDNQVSLNISSILWVFKAPFTFTLSLTLTVTLIVLISLLVQHSRPNLFVT